MSHTYTAVVVAEISWPLSTAKVYRLSTPVRWLGVGSHISSGMTDYVVVSAVPFTPFGPGGPEAMAWACDEHGNFLAGEDRGESLSVAREFRHDAAVEALGFEVVPGSEPVKRVGFSDVPPTRKEMEAFNRELRAAQESAHKTFLLLNPKPALEALREAESALAIKASLRAPEQARVERALEKARETLERYREAGL